MSDFDYCVLKTMGDVIIAYLAPSARINPHVKPDIPFFLLPRGKGTKGRDLLKRLHEITIQGELVSTDKSEMPADHIAALSTLFGGLPVSATDQINRIYHYLMTFPGPYKLFIGNDEYTKTIPNDVDYEDGKFPTVFIDDFIPAQDAGLTRRGFVIKFRVSFEA